MIKFNLILIIFLVLILLTSKIALANTITLTTVDTGTEVGRLSAVALGLDGFARIIYYDKGPFPGHLKYARCLDDICSTKNITIVDLFGDDDIDPSDSIKIGTDGFARIVYYDKSVSGGKLKYAICNDEDCSNPTISTIDDPISGNAGKMNSLALDALDNPYISYHKGTDDGSGGKVMMARYIGSGGTGCSGNSAWNCTEIDTRAQYTSIALASDTFPRISYYKQSSQDLNFVQCGDADCSIKTIIPVDTSGRVGEFQSMTLGQDGFARIAYRNYPNLIKYVQCTSIDCSTKNISSIDVDDNDYMSVALASDGFARISYYDASTDEIRYAKCTEASCSAGNTSTSTIATSIIAAQGINTSIALDPDNSVYFAYYDGGIDGVRLALIRSTPTLPTVSSFASSSVTDSSAILNGTVTARGASNVTARGFGWGTSIVYDATTTESGSFGLGTLSSNLASLSCGTTYHFRAYATNNVGTGYGSDRTFTTSSCPIVISISPVSSSPANGPIIGSAGEGSYIQPMISRPQIIYPDGRVLYLDATSTLPESFILPDKPDFNVTSPYPVFDHALGSGSIDVDVKSLQIYLNTHGYILTNTGFGSPGNETTTFGSLTRAALQKLQCDKLAICSGIWFTTGYGNFGPRTREWVNRNR